MKVKAIMTTTWDSDIEHEGVVYKKGDIAVEKDKVYEVEKKTLVPIDKPLTFRDTDITVTKDYYRYELKGLPGSTAAFAFIQISELTDSYA